MEKLLSLIHISTLLNCIGGLDVVDSGSIQVDGQEMVGLKMDALSDYLAFLKVSTPPIPMKNPIEIYSFAIGAA